MTAATTDTAPAPPRPSALQHRDGIVGGLRTLWDFRELLWLWVLREIKVRYKQSVLGAAWAVLEPLSLTLIFTVVFSVFTRMPTGDVPYALFAYTALVPWTFFAGSINMAVPTLIKNLDLVTKIYFPREVLPVACLGAGLIDFGIALVVWVGMALAFGASLHWTLLYLPVLVAVQLLLMSGVALLMSAVVVRLRDMRFVVPLVLQLWLYASPVIYPVSVVPEPLRPWYLLNPMAALIASYRRVMLEGLPPQWGYVGLAAVVSTLAFLVGYGYFRRAEKLMADVI